jgi:hypothetical protein
MTRVHRQEVALRIARSALFGISLLAGVAQAQASSDPQVWQGEVFITGFTNGTAKTVCTDDGVAAVGDFYLLVYRPIIKGSPENGVSSDEGLTFFSSRDATHYNTDDGVSFAKPGKGYVTFFSSHAEARAQPTMPPASVPFDLKITPAKISLTTPTIAITGSVDDFDDVSGCNVTLAASLVRRVD